MVKKPTEDSRLSTLIDYYLDSKSYRNLSPTSQKEYSLNLKVVRRDKLEKVRNAADALSQLYSHAGDYEMGVSYYINHDPYINS